MVAEAAQQLGGLHILVNSGSSPGGSATATGPIETVVDEDLIQDFNVKYVGALRCSRAVIPFMKKAGLGPHHQHQRCQRPQRRQSQRRRTQRLPRAHDQDAGGANGPSWHHGQLHPSRHDPHRAHAEPARGPRRPTGRIPEEAERQDFAPDSPRGNAICRMVDASEIAFVTVFLASDKAWAVSGELVAATGGAGRTVHY
jgi:NAD(P)-dependent dehydrogenase (short-subunit alcohol dehydrogenase family)